MVFPIEWFSRCPWVASISESFHDYVMHGVSCEGCDVEILHSETRNFTDCVNLSPQAYYQLKNMSYPIDDNMKFREVVALTIPINTFLLFAPPFIFHLKIFKNLKPSVKYFYLAATIAFVSTISMFTESRPSMIASAILSTLILLAFVFNARRCLEVARKPPLQNQRGHCEFVTFSRTAYLFVTAIAILAIDFPWMPRLRKKSEFGFTLMDTGVGCSTFFAGLSTNWGAHRLNLKKVLPIFALSLLRFCVHSKLGILANPTEYGIHWNFFSTLFTIFVVSISIEGAFPKLTTRQMMGISASLGIFYEILLTNGLANFILTAPRIDFISMNKEGLFGTIGYFVVYFWGVAIGNFLRQSRTEPRAYLLRKLVTHFVLVIGAEKIYSFKSGFESSRRLTNLSFMLLSLSLNICILTVCLIGEIIRDSYFDTSIKTKRGWIASRVLDDWIPKSGEWNLPASDLSAHLLFVFLQANLQTGLVGLCVKTLQSSYVEATLITFTHSIALFALPALGTWLKSRKTGIKKK